MADGDAGVLPRIIQSVANLRHRTNSATSDVSARHRINWVDTATVTWTVTDSSVNDEVSVSGAAGASSSVSGYYGDASDGTATLDGSTTVAGMAPSSNVYTAVRDLYFASLTVNNGQTLKMAGYRLFVNGTLTNNGIVSSNGNNGANGAGTGGAGGGTAPAGTIGGSGNGGAGGNNNSVGSAGVGATGGIGGNGAAGGISGTGRAGGAGGTATPPAAVDGGIPRAVPLAVTLLFFPGAVPTYLSGGAGGGGGGAGNTATGGGGGGGGDLLLVVARLIAGTGVMTATGGTGGNAAGTGGAGGGGGGGGGGVFIISSSVSAGAVSGQTITAAGGVGGTLIGTGATGSTGSAGNVIYIQG